MESPTPEYEKKILRDVVEQMRDPDHTMRKQTLVRRAIYAFGYFGLVVSFILAMNEISHPFTAAFLAAASGCAVGFALFLNFAHKQWPITRNHINIESVEKRLKDLEVYRDNKPDT